jgi:glutathione S-transferase
MLRHKGFEPDVVELLPGAQPVVLRGLGYRHGTVPALKLDGRRIQGSLAIARELERVRPQPALYPAPVERRRRVEEAERWGEAEYQPVPRRLFRWQCTRSLAARRWLMEASGVPLADVAGAAILPITFFFACASGADERQVRADVATVPGHLDRIEALIADGVLDGKQLNAADFQIGTTTRALLGFPELAPLIEGRPAGSHARRVLPDHPGPMPPGIPASWL